MIKSGPDKQANVWDVESSKKKIMPTPYGPGNQENIISFLWLEVCICSKGKVQSPWQSSVRLYWPKSSQNLFGLTFRKLASKVVTNPKLWNN